MLFGISSREPSVYIPILWLRVILPAISLNSFWDSCSEIYLSINAPVTVSMITFMSLGELLISYSCILLDEYKASIGTSQRALLASFFLITPFFRALLFSQNFFLKRQVPSLATLFSWHPEH